ncbi:DUF4403 family protein [Fibrivirga algicola]|uniref:DUF4403 family protein n=1 Tax=Fibrivirga algicola TaxID=2950420 RepID=A0ABX0QK30_9BACT|nr:DUF4403 family protein [Fibrivirga algicola]NID12188.1 DUF4403 family protein [Fibrivirga algicola]
MIPPRYTYILVTLLALCWATACQKVKPKAPTAEGFDPPIPEAFSFLAGPITFQIKSLEDKINASIKTEIVSPETMKGQKGASFNMRVRRTGRIRIRYVNHKVTFSAPLEIWLDNPIRLRKKNHAKEALCALLVDFQSPLQVASDWRLTTRVSLVKHTWIKPPKVRVLGINIPFANLAESVIQKRRPEIEKAIDEAVYEGLRLDKQVKPVWLDLQKPLVLAKKPDSLWLVPTPFSVAVGEVTGDEKTLTVPIRVAFYTKTVIGPRPKIALNRTLPTIRRDKHIKQVTDLRVMNFISYDDINRILAKQLKGRKLELAGGLLTINKTTVYGGQHAVIIRADVGGAVKGTLFFRGQPAYDTLTHTLLVKNIDFDVETEERLLSTADWLLHDRLNDTLAKALKFPIRQQIDKLPTLIDTAFEKAKAGKKNDLDILTFQFVPQIIAIRPDGIQALLKVETTVAFKVKKL